MKRMPAPVSSALRWAVTAGGAAGRPHRALFETPFYHTNLLESGGLDPAVGAAVVAWAGREIRSHARARCTRPS